VGGKIPNKGGGGVKLEKKKESSKYEKTVRAKKRKKGGGHRNLPFTSQWPFGGGTIASTRISKAGGKKKARGSVPNYQS